jgi:hypothetical protein
MFDKQINNLRKQIDKKDKQIRKSTSDSRIRKELVKHSLLSYFHTRLDKRQNPGPTERRVNGYKPAKNGRKRRS